MTNLKKRTLSQLHPSNSERQPALSPRLLSILGLGWMEVWMSMRGRDISWLQWGCGLLLMGTSRIGSGMELKESMGILGFGGRVEKGGEFAIYSLK